MEQLDFQINEKYLQMFPVYCADEEERHDFIPRQRPGEEAQEYPMVYIPNEQLNFGGGEKPSSEKLFREGEPIYIKKGMSSMVDHTKQIHFSSAAIKRKKLESSFPEKENKSRRGNSSGRSGGKKSKSQFKKPRKPKGKRSVSKESKGLAVNWNPDVKSSGLFDPRMRKNQLRNEEFLMEVLARDTGKKRDLRQAEDMRIAPPAFETYNNIYEIQTRLDEENQIKMKKLKDIQEREIKLLKKKLEEEEKRTAAIDKKYQEKYRKLEMQRAVQVEVANKIKQVKEVEKDLSRNKKSVMEKTVGGLKKGKLNSEQILGKEEQPPAVQQFPNEEKLGIDQETWKTTLDLLQYNALKQQEEFDQVDKSDVDLIPTRERSSDKTGGKRSKSRSKNKDQGVQIRKLFESDVRTNENRNMEYELELREMEARELQRQKELDRLVAEHKRKMAGQPEPNEEHDRIEQKLQNIKGNLEPLLKGLKKKKKTARAYPFTGNLLARASAKLIQTYAEDLTERLLDDLLVEVVLILNEQEAMEKEIAKAEKRKALFADYSEAFKELEYEQEQIKNNLHKKETASKPGAGERIFREMEFYKAIGIEKQKHKVIELSLGQIDSIFENKKRFLNDLKDDENSTKDRLKAYEYITAEIVGELYDEVYEEIDKMQDDFVETVFKQEFY